MFENGKYFGLYSSELQVVTLLWLYKVENTEFETFFLWLYLNLKIWVDF